MKDERLFLGDLHPVCVLRGLLYNLWVLILAVLTAWLCVEGYHLFTYHPVYTASATVAVNVKGGTSVYTSLDLTARMAQVFASVFQSDTFREAAQCDVVASVLPETNLINVQVTAENPRESFLSLKNVLENHADLTDELFSNAELRVIRDPQVPLAPSNPVDLKPYRMRACVGAMLAASLIVSVLFLRRDTVQTPQAARHKLDGRVLGTIGHERKEKRLFVKKSRGAGRKAAALLTDPFVRYTYTEAYQDLCAALEHRMRRDGKKVLLLTGAGENEGKSSVAANLALALSHARAACAAVGSRFKKTGIAQNFRPAGRRLKTGSGSICRQRKTRSRRLFFRKNTAFLSALPRLPRTRSAFCTAKS